MMTAPFRYYLVLFNAPGEVREYTPEAELPQTEAEALEQIEQVGWPVMRVLELHDDVPPRDVTEDLAIIAYRKWTDGGADLRSDPVPQFIHDHAPSSCDCGYRGRLEAAE